MAYTHKSSEQLDEYLSAYDGAPMTARQLRRTLGDIHTDGQCKAALLRHGKLLRCGKGRGDERSIISYVEQSPQSITAADLAAMFDRPLQYCQSLLHRKGKLKAVRRKSSDPSRLVAQLTEPTTSREFCRQFGIKHSGGVWLALKKAGKLSQSAEGRPRGKATTPYRKVETEEIRKSKQFIDDLFTRFLDRKYEDRYLD